jgi:hypothetical protein
MDNSKRFKKFGQKVGLLHDKASGRTKTRTKSMAILAIGMMMAYGVVSNNNNLLPAAFAANTLTVQAKTISDGKTLNMWTVITQQSTGSVVKSGLTPLTFVGTPGITYTVTVSDYGSIVFDHWGSGSTNRSRTFTQGTTNLWFDAFFKSGSTTTSTTTTTTTTSTTSSLKTLLPKTGVNVALYAYPSGTGASEWQKVYDQKVAHPSVPMAITFNPATGPGSYKDSNFASWISKLQSVGVIAIGYTYDNYGARSLYDINRDADKYKSWYNANGMFIDEVTNKIGFEQHYRDINAYAHSVGMKITIGNPGTDVPQTFMGTLDMFNITEGTGYVPISWLQYCVLCTSSGWHQNFDKRNFSYIRYSISSLDTAFEVNSSQYVGLLYLTNGSDSDGRWFHVPSYFGTEVATLDR